MMNHNTKTFFILLLAAGILMPMPSLAYQPLLQIDPNKLKLTPKLPPAVAKNSEEFCSNFSSTSDELSKRFGSFREKVDTFVNKHEENVDDRRNARDAKLEESRSKADERRSEWYARLEDKAETDGQKDAVVKFKQTIEKAVDDRRDVVDDAISDFRKAMDDLHATRLTALKTNRDTFRTAFDDALAQVTSDCEKGLTTQQIKKNFRTNLKEARTELKSDQQNETKIKDQIHTLQIAKNAALKKAFADFNTTLNTAKADLKQAFGE